MSQPPIASWQSMRMFAGCRKELDLWIVAPFLLLDLHFPPPARNVARVAIGMDCPPAKPFSTHVTHTVGPNARSDRCGPNLLALCHAASLTQTNERGARSIAAVRTLDSAHLGHSIVIIRFVLHQFRYVESILSRTQSELSARSLKSTQPPRPPAAFTETHTCTRVNPSPNLG